MTRLLILALALFVLVPAPVGAETLTGRASVIDGDTLEIHGTRIRLHGIDAPEGEQTCQMRDKTVRCGQQAAFALADKVGSRAITCEGGERDRYGRLIAVCRLRGQDLNAWMVTQGWALAYRYYSSDYVGQEARASARKRGLWQGEFVAPWDWRQARRAQTAEARQPIALVRQPAAQTREARDCVIKGNISTRSGERIYHVPGGEYYERTRVSPAKGERWFCSEQEAMAAGWRPSRR